VRQKTCLSLVRHAVVNESGKRDDAAFVHARAYESQILSLSLSLSLTHTRTHTHTHSARQVKVHALVNERVERGDAAFVHARVYEAQIVRLKAQLAAATKSGKKASTLTDELVSMQRLSQQVCCRSVLQECVAGACCRSVLQ